MRPRHNPGGWKRVIHGSAVVILIATIAGCGKPFPAPASEGEFERVVLIEEGTGTWCVNCPAAAENLQALLAAHPDSVIVLALHGWTSSPFDPYATTETDARLTRLGIENFPTVMFDGVEVMVGAKPLADMESLYEDRRALGSPVKIELEAAMDGNDVTYAITLIASPLYPADIEGTLRIALVENHVDYSDQLWSGLNHVVRLIPQPAGEDEVTLQPGDTVEMERILAADPTWSRPLTAVVWLEAEDLEAYQAASEQITEGPDLGDFSIGLDSDTTQTATQPGDSAEFDFTVTNHTDSTLRLHIEAPDSLLEMPSGWDWRVSDDTQQYPDSGFDIQVLAGSESQTFTVTMISGTQGYQGKVVLSVSAGGTEVDMQTFVLYSNPPDFSIELLGDTIKTDTAGAAVNFYFNLHNLTDSDLQLTVDTAEVQLPTGWWIMMCDEFLCYPIPVDTLLPPWGSWKNLHMTIASSQEGAEGKVVMEVSSPDEVEQQTFILQILN